MCVFFFPSETCDGWCLDMSPTVLWELYHIHPYQFFFSVCMWCPCILMSIPMINHYILILLMKVRNPAPPGMYKIRCNSGSFDLELRNTTVSCHLEHHKILLALYLGLVLTLKDIRNLVAFCDFTLIHWRAIGCIHISIPSKQQHHESKKWTAPLEPCF